MEAYIFLIGGIILSSLFGAIWLAQIFMVLLGVIMLQDWYYREV